MEFRIRKAKLSDAESLARLYFQFWEPHKKVDPLLEFEKRLTLKSQTESAKKGYQKKEQPHPCCRSGGRSDRVYRVFYQEK